MSELPLLIWPVLLFLALLMGFVADRTNLCTVSAVGEIAARENQYLEGFPVNNKLIRRLLT